MKKVIYLYEGSSNKKGIHRVFLRTVCEQYANSMRTVCEQYANSMRTVCEQYANSRAAFNEWIYKVKFADWEKPEDIFYTFNSADLLGNGSDRVIFDIGGNNHRIICKYWFGKKRVHLYIKWIGKHADYSFLCKKGNQYLIDQF